MAKQEIYDRDEGVCFYCGKKITFEESTIEHLLSKTHGGKDNDHNLTITCKSCNLEAGSLDVVKKVKLREQNLFADDLKERDKKITTLIIGDIRIKVEE